MPPSVATSIEEWFAAVREVPELLAADDARLARVVAAVSGWSAVHHAAHVTLANELVLRNVRSLAKGSGMLVVENATPNPQALAILERGVLPRGAAKAPRMVVPPPEIVPATAREWATQLVRDVEELASAFDADAARPGLSIPHQSLGALDLAQWVRFGAVHTRHHLAIAREVLRTHA